MAGAVLVGPERFSSVQRFGVGHDVGLPGDAAADAVEGALGAEVDGAGGGVGIDIGADGLVDLDGFHRVEGGHLHGEGAGGTGGGVVGIGAGEGDAVHGDGGVLGAEAAEADGADLAVEKVELDAGEVLEEFADVALGVVAKRIGGDGVGDVHGIALVHDGLGAALALGGDGKGGELNGAVGRGGAGFLQRADELDVLGRGGAGGDIDGGGDGAVAGISDDEGEPPGRDRVEAKCALGLGDGGGPGLDEAKLGVADVFAGGGIVDLADDDAAASGGRNGSAGGRGSLRG